MKRLNQCVLAVASMVAVVLVLAPSLPSSAAAADVSAGSMRSLAVANQYFSGNGDDSIHLTLSKGLVVIDFAVSGTESNFIVWLRTSGGDDVALGANSIGEYSGTVAARVPSTGNYHLDVQSDGDWEIAARQPRASTAPKTRSWSGTGESVSGLFYLGAGTYRFAGSHQGESNFIVELVNQDGETVHYLANEIGATSASEVFTVEKAGVYVLSVDADGPWTASIKSRYIAYKFSKFTTPTHGHRGKWFTVSVRIRPTYIGPSSRPVTMYAQKKSGRRWVKTMKVRLYGDDHATYTKYAARLSVSRGTWRVWATFKDATHRTKKTAYKKVRVR